jgi:hypothetical protein
MWICTCTMHSLSTVNACRRPMASTLQAWCLHVHGAWQQYRTDYSDYYGRRQMITCWQRSLMEFVEWREEIFNVIETVTLSSVIGSFRRWSVAHLTDGAGVTSHRLRKEGHCNISRLLGKLEQACQIWYNCASCRLIYSLLFNVYIHACNNC